MSDPKPEAILVLGASRGLGRTIAVGLSRAGFAVGLGCRQESDAQEIGDEISAAGGVALPLAVDVTDFHQVQAATNAVKRTFGSIGGVINNAGLIEPIGHIGETNETDWKRLIEVNLIGAYYGIKALLEASRDPAIVVNISSGAASKVMEGWSAYCASKAAVSMLTRSVHHEYSARGVLSYGLRPGIVDTGMQGKIRTSGMNDVSKIPRENLLKPEVPAAVVVWLCSARPLDLSGEELDVRDADLQRRMAAPNEE